MPTALPARDATVEIPAGAVPALGQELLDELLGAHLIRERDWAALSPAVRRELAAHRQQDPLLDELARRQLLTPYQAGRLKGGAVFGLVLGNYRVLDVL